MPFVEDGDQVKIKRSEMGNAMASLSNSLPLRGRWLCYALWCLAGFAGTYVTSHFAILCFLPVPGMLGLGYWAAYRKGDWGYLGSFALGFLAITCLILVRFQAIMREVD